MIRTHSIKRTIGKGLAVIIAFVLLAGMVSFYTVTVYAAATSAGTEAALRSAVDKGGDVKMTKSILLTETLTIPAGKTVTLDLNGKTLDRGLTVCQEKGSVILVEKGASLTVKDSEGKNAGTITGGASYLGGGIRNHGTLIIEQGVITGNKAQDTFYGFGGGVYSCGSAGTTASVTIKGGSVTGNSARIGGGIYNSSSSEMTVMSGSYKVKTNTYVTDLSVKGNKAALFGGGIYNAGTLKMQDKPVVAENETDNIFLTTGKVITITGALGSGAKLGVTAQQTDAIVTAGYGAYNTARPETVFSSGETAVVMLTAAENGEVRLKNSAQTAVQVFENAKLTRSEEYDSPQSAWDKAISCADSSKRVEITLGSDWEHDSELFIGSGKNIIIDLNGHYILRKRNLRQIDNGGVFRIASDAVLTVKDSRPNVKGYDGVKGGVITGGASGNTGGGVHMEKDSSFIMEGGTIYECVTSYDGGGICAPDGAKKLSLSNCRIYCCQTIDSIDDCNGGGIYAKDVGDISLRDMTIQDCYSEDNGGAMYHYGFSGYSFIIDNCRFIGNKCLDDGGALYLYESAGMRVDNSTFSTNKAGDDGGAIYVAQSDYYYEKHDPVAIRESVLTFNECGDEGSAIFVDKKGVVIVGDTITDNYAGDKGSVYLSHYGGMYGYDISVKGRTIIKDNTAEDNDHRDIVLENFGGTNNYIYDAGLYEGSYISFGALGSGKIPAIKEVSEYQLRFFHPENGTLTLDDTREVEAPMATASLFVDSSYTLLIIIACLAIAAAAAAVIIKKTKGGESDDITEEK